MINYKHREDMDQANGFRCDAPQSRGLASSCGGRCTSDAPFGDPGIYR